MKLDYLKEEELEKEISEAKGNLSAVARKLNISRTSLANYVRKKMANIISKKYEVDNSLVLKEQKRFINEYERNHTSMELKKHHEKMKEMHRKEMERTKRIEKLQYGKEKILEKRRIEKRIETTKIFASNQERLDYYDNFPNKYK